jgi:hypothetical protein
MGWSEVIRYRQFGMWDFRCVEEAENVQWQLCNVCGDQLGQDKIFGLGDWGYPESNDGRFISTGNGMHARCALLSFHYCPHFQGREGEVWPSRALDPDRCFALTSTPGPGFMTYEQADLDDPISVVWVPDYTPLTMEQLRARAKAEAPAPAGRCPLATDTLTS